MEGLSKETKEKNISYIIEPADHAITKELLSRFEKYDPEKVLKRLTGRSLSFESYRIVHEESQGDGAGWIDGEGALVNFNKGASYVWLCVAHEMAHQFLQEAPAWQDLPGISEIIDRNRSYESDNYDYSFRYAIEQTMACLLQAACESEAPDTRPLEWNRWEDTFGGMSVLDIAEKFWQPFLDYLKNPVKYPSIDHFILEVLRKNY